MEKNKCSSKITHRGEEEKKVISNRINRIEGQLKGVKKMIEQDAYCNDVLIQLSATPKLCEEFIKSLIRKSFI